MVVIHIFALAILVSGATAMLTAQANAARARDLEVQAALKKKLDQGAEVRPAPPAADFRSRYRPIDH
jgi:hypothetical protein